MLGVYFKSNLTLKNRFIRWNLYSFIYYIDLILVDTPLPNTWKKFNNNAIFNQNYVILLFRDK